MKKLLIALFLIVSSLPAFSQNTNVRICFSNLSDGSNCVPVSPTNPFPVTNSGSGATAQQIQGNVAAAATDSGNPVKVGGVYNTTVPTYTNGQRTDLQTGTRGSLNVQLMTADSASALNVAATSVDGVTPIGGATTLSVRGVNYIFNGSNFDRQRGTTQGTWSNTAVSSDAGVASTPVVTAAAANNLVLKASAGNLYSVTAANHTATAGFLVVLNSTTSPADGAITPLACQALPANGNASITFGAPTRYSTGITAVLTSDATCFVKTTGVITGFIAGVAQ